jgi:hypothetical protein
MLVEGEVRMIASAAADDGVVCKATSAEDLCRKVHAFLVGEFKRQCLGVDFFYSPGDGYRDEIIRSWTCENDAEFFGDAEGSPNLVKLAAQIVEIAEGEADAKAAGRHRFFVRTHQHLGARHMMSFALSPAYTGEYKETPMSKNDGKKAGADSAAALDPRKQLLAGMAAHLAASVLLEGSENTTSPDAIAEISVDVAEAILKRVGL